MSNQFPHYSVRIVDDDGKMTREGLRFLQSMWERLPEETTYNDAISSTAGATYGATEQAMLNDIKALLNQIRAAL